MAERTPYRLGFHPLTRDEIRARIEARQADEDAARAFENDPEVMCVVCEKPGAHAHQQRRQEAA